MRARYRVEPGSKLSRKEEENKPATVPEPPGRGGRREGWGKQETRLSGSHHRGMWQPVPVAPFTCLAGKLTSAPELHGKGWGWSGIFPAAMSGRVKESKLRSKGIG